MIKKCGCVLVIILICLLSFISCQKENVADESSALYDTGYTSLTCKKTQDYKEFYFGVGDSSRILELTFPENWNLRADKNNGYNIFTRDGIIGTLYFSKTAKEHDKRCLSHTVKEGEKVNRTVCVLKKSDNEGYVHCITYTYDDNNGTQNITIEVEYTELDQNAHKRVDFLADVVLSKDEDLFGNLPLSKGNNKQSILILGNSFVNSSKISEALNNMLKAGGKEVTVNAVSRGYATVTSYSGNEQYMAPIRNGDYGIVFMCGFYSNQDISSFKKIVSACETSNTILVVFPAHNESREVITAASYGFKDDVYFLDWKQEIDELINSKLVTDADMYFFDQHKHSTPLAGFVGAHMIYREIFGTTPEKFSGGEISTAIAERSLKDYVYSGQLDSIPEKNINRF